VFGIAATIAAIIEYRSPTAWAYPRPRDLLAKVDAYVPGRG
jgi:hypothetical protein